jgi:hypothetical protein
VTLARRFVELQLAATLAEVAVRLNATPGGVLDVRRQLAVDTRRLSVRTLPIRYLFRSPPLPHRRVGRVRTVTLHTC